MACFGRLVRCDSTDHVCAIDSEAGPGIGFERAWRACAHDSPRTTLHRPLAKCAATGHVTAAEHDRTFPLGRFSYRRLPQLSGIHLNSG